MTINIKNNELKIPIILNILLFFIIYFDYNFPVENIIEKKFVAFYNEVNTLPRIKGGGGKEVKYILECSDGELYHLYTFPKNSSEFIVGQKIYILKTFFLSKTKALKLNLKSNNIKISILSTRYINIFFTIAIIITVLNLFYSNTILDIFLMFSSAYIYLVTLVYLIFL